jgi:cytochrome c2
MNRTSKAIYLYLVVVFALLLSACTAVVNGVPEPRHPPEDDVEAGRRLIMSYGCGSCHTIPGVPGADAKVAPPLDHFYQRSFIAGHLPNTQDNLIKWIQNPQQVEPGTAMPVLGVSADEAKAIAAYLYHQPSILDWFDR